MSKIGVFYGPEKGSTEKVARIIVEKLGEDKADLLSIEKTSCEDFLKYDKLVLGVATVGRDTWDTDHGKRGWDVFLPKFQAVESMQNKTVAVFGLGNQVTYPTMFCDAIGTVATEMENKGATIAGAVATDGYDFQESVAVVDNKFVGLPLDEDTEEELTEERVSAWVTNLKQVFAI